MGSDLGHEPSYDTHLARLLHERGRVGVEVLQGLLARTREQRDLDPSLSLALSLVQEGILSREEADAYLAELDPRQAPTAPGSQTTSGERALGWAPGGKVDRYKIIEHLGRGAMGTVFRAERDGEQVAIKVLPLQAEAALRERFQREYDAQSGINPHPNVVRVRGAGSAHGALYLVLDLATGGDLQTRLRQGPLPIPDAVELGRQLARGLAHVHAHGVLHRDLKPGNVLFDDQGAPKLVDFGLARSIGGASNLTQTGELLGTPSYMAPEQATAIRGEVSPVSDVYGLGAVLFHALTGRPPFVGASTLDVLTQLLTAPAPRASSLRPAVPPALDAIVARCLSKDPAERYPSADALADALEAVQLGRPRQIPRWLIAAAGVSVLLAAAAIALGPRRAPPETGASGSAPPTRSETSAPRPRRAAQPLDLWSPPVGLKLETKVETDARRQLYIAGREVAADRINGKFTAEVLLKGEVVRSEPQRVDIEVTIASFRIHNVGGVAGPQLYDSRVPAHQDQPFKAALGVSFVFTLDPRTGTVTEIDGADRAQQAVLDALPSGSDHRLYMVDLFQPTILFDFLNRVWCVLPHPRVEANSWTVTPPPPRHMKVITSFLHLVFITQGINLKGKLPEGPIARQVRVTTRVGSALHVNWKARRDARRYRADAVIVGGLVRSAKIHESIEFHGTRQGHEVRWAFENEYAAELKVLDAP